MLKKIRIETDGQVKSYFVLLFLTVQSWSVFTKYGVGWIHGHLVLGSISNQPLCVCEGHITWCGSVPLVISNDLHFAMLEDTHTWISGTQVNAYCWSFRHLQKTNKKTFSISAHLHWQFNLKSVHMVFITPMSLYILLLKPQKLLWYHLELCASTRNLDVFQ